MGKYLCHQSILSKFLEELDQLIYWDTSFLLTGLLPDNFALDISAPQI